MATLYRFSFEHEIIPNGVTIAGGNIWSGCGRFGTSTSALVATSSNASSYAAVTASLPSGTVGVRGSYYTKTSVSASYPCDLAKVGPFTFGLSDASTTFLKNGATTVATQDITTIQNNRWNLVRFLTNFEPSGNSSTGSIEFNGINLQWAGSTGATSASQVILNGIKSNISSIDDVGINDGLGSLDNNVPGSIRGMVGGLMADGDIQNWQQNADSLPPTKVPLKYLGGLTYIPNQDLVIAYDKYITGSHSVSNFTTINAQTNVTRSKWATSFVVNEVVYSEYDHMVYLYGMITNTLQYAKYDPAVDAIVSTGSFVPPLTNWSLQANGVMSATYCEVNSKILILQQAQSDEERDASGFPTPQPSAGVRIVSHNLIDNSLELSQYAYRVYSIYDSPTAAPRPTGTIFYNSIDKKVYIYCQMITAKAGLAVIDPTTLFYVNKNEPAWPGGKPTLGTASFCLSDINNHAFLATYNIGDTGPGEIWRIDMNTLTGSKVIAQNEPYTGTYIKDITYSPGRNAIYAVGTATSYLFDPFKAAAGLGAASIIEYIPSIFNAFEVIYCPKNSAVIASTTDQIYNYRGSLEASVVNALMSPDSLKAGATASGDICTVQIAKPSGSFTNGFTYEGMNIRVDNASSLSTASLLLGVRDGGSNVQISSSLTTWGNSQTTAVRSIFSVQGSGSAKWTEAQFKNVQFYMEAGPEL